MGKIRIFRLIAGIIAAFGLVLAGMAAPASAHQDGTCDTGDLCLWYYSWYQGAHSDFYFGDRNLWNNYYNGCGQYSCTGYGAVVANNSESDYNYDYNYGVYVHTGRYCTGTHGYIKPRTGGTFNSLFRNNVESISWYSTTSC